MIKFKYPLTCLFVLIFLALIPGRGDSGAAPELTDMQLKLSESLINAYKAGEGHFWTAFEDNDVEIDGPVLEKVLSHSIESRDERLINIILEAARKKNGQNILAAMTLRAADFFLFASRLDQGLKLYDASMPLARNSDDPGLMARSFEGNGDAAFYQGNPTAALMMYSKASELYAKHGSNIDRSTVARKTGGCIRSDR